MKAPQERRPPEIRTHTSKKMFKALCRSASSVEKTFTSQIAQAGNMDHTDQTQSTTRSWFKQLALLLCLVAVIRASTGWLGWHLLKEDTDSYACLAVSLSEHGVYGFASEGKSISPTAFRPPLYPGLLSWLVSESELSARGVYLLHLAMSLGVAVFSFSIASRLNLKWPLLAGLLVTVDPLLTRASQQVMTELLATLLALAAWWLWLVVWPVIGYGQCHSTKRSTSQWLSLYVLGIVFGLSILARPTAAPWVAMCVPFMLWFGCVCWKRRIVDALVVTTGVAVCVLPWTIRNMAEFGKPIWATTHGGYTLLLANNPSLYEHLKRNGPDREWNAEHFHSAWASRGKVAREEMFKEEFWMQSDSNPTLEESADSGIDENSVHSLGELADDALAYKLATQSIRNNPSMFVLSCFYRFGWLWAWWPSGVGLVTRLVIGSWYCTMTVFAVKGLFRLVAKWRSDSYQRTVDFTERNYGSLGHWLPGIALLVAVSAIHCFFWSNMRMRAPLMPCVYLLALITIAEGQRVRR
jgi:hypothetical protein